MNNGILNEKLLEKNIEVIDFYLNEEKTLLNEINNKINETSNHYHSTNMALLMNNKFESNINYIYNKRIKYITVLNNVILRYQKSADDTVKIFNNMQP